MNNVSLGGYNKFSQVMGYDGNNHRTDSYTNARGQLIAVREYSGTSSHVLYSTTTYGYDTPGNLVDVWEHANNNTDMVYDAFGRKTQMTDPDMGTWSYNYDAADNLLFQIDANQNKLCFTYDGLNRLLIKRYAASATAACPASGNQLAQYIYHTGGTGSLGQISQIRWSDSSSQNRENFVYDSLGRLTTHTRTVDSRQYTMSYSNFDAFHRPGTVTYPNGQTAVTSFDHEGANSLSNSGTSLISNIHYNARGQMTFLDRTSGGIDTTYLYHPQNDASGGGLGDSNYRLKTIQHGAAGTGNAWPDFLTNMTM